MNFHLSGINNQNFIMRDEETGSWWQQVTGEAIQGPLKGSKLKPVYHDELSFGIWKREQPNGRVLKPDPRVASRYESAEWEKEYENFPVVVSVDAADKLKPRSLIIGIKNKGESRAYPFEALEKQSPIIDNIGDLPLLLLLGEDKKSVRAFDRRVDGKTLEFFLKTDGGELRLLDAETGSEWNFAGRGIKGNLTSKSLAPVTLLKDYWFDWKNYNPKTTVYTLGER